jgi:arginine utilization protein RocB
MENRIRELLLDLCSVKSVSGSSGESEMGRKIHSILAKLSCFSGERSGNLKTIDCDGRPAVLAFMEASGGSSVTLGLTGHFDVVSASVYGDLAEVAFDPERLTADIVMRELSESVRKDLDEGWLFGRGTADMKCGLAVHMALMEKWDREGAPCNVLFLAVPDEENLSLGMRKAVPEVARFLEERGLSVSAWVNGEPTVGAKGSSWPVHRGSIGKAMGFVLSVGVGSHVGEFFKGISAVQIAGQINSHLEGGPESADRLGDLIFPPAACLGLEALRDGYSVTLYDRVMARYNLLYCSRSPEELLKVLLSSAREGLARAIDLTSWSARKLGGSLSLPESQVMTLSELRKVAGEADPVGGNVSGSPVDVAAAEVLSLLDKSGLEGPMAVVGFLPPLYPPTVAVDDEAEGRLNRALEAVFDLARERGYEPVKEPIFEGISDLSYLGRAVGNGDMSVLKENMAGWGDLYDVPFEAMKAVQAPVCNLGPFGKDVHKATERLEPHFAFSVLPDLVERLAVELARSRA